MDQAPPMAYRRPETVSTGEWFVTLLIASIPLVGLIMLFVWAFGGGAAASKQNWAKAMLLWMLVCILLVMALYVLIIILAVASGAAIAPVQ